MKKIEHTKVQNTTPNTRFLSKYESISSKNNNSKTYSVKNKCVSNPDLNYVKLPKI